MVMSKNKNRHLGSSLESFLEEEGQLEQARHSAIKRVLAFQISEAMERLELTKSKLAEEMGTSRSALDRLLDPDNDSVTLDTLKRAAQATGKRLEVRLVDIR